MSHEFRIIQGCPCPKNIAPYIELVTQRAHAQVESIYRGDDARALLNKYGHHSQQQLYDATPTQRREWGILGTPNKPGQSTHELKSDDRAYPVLLGHNLAWWQQGFDVNDADAENCVIAAQHFGWHLWRPYPGSVEDHHLNFREKPKPGKYVLSIIKLRLTLPKS